MDRYCRVFSPAQITFLSADLPPLLLAEETQAKVGYQDLNYSHSRPKSLVIEGLMSALKWEKAKAGRDREWSRRKRLAITG